mgnify:CR=1 FL=1
MKLTAHHMGGSSSAFRLAIEGGAQVVKLVHSFGEASLYKAARPGIKIIGRAFIEFNADASVDPEADARANFARMLPHILSNPLVDYWESNNEPGGKTEREVSHLARYCAEFMRECERHGKRACIANFSTGQPEPELWPLMGPTLEQAARGGHLLGLHEYIGEPGSDTWQQFRYRRLLQWAARTGTRLPNIAITECGLDNIDGRGPWRAWLGNGPEAAQRYVEELVRYELGLRHDAEIIGACLFTSGTLGSDVWRPYDIDDSEVVDRLLAWNRANPETPPARPPSPGTHTVVAGVLNVRRWPWTGNAEPPVVRQVRLGERVVVRGWYRPDGLPTGWACLSPNANEWVNGRYLV